MAWALQSGTNDTNRKHNSRRSLDNVTLSSDGKYAWGLAQVGGEKEEEVETSDEEEEVVDGEVTDGGESDGEGDDDDIEDIVEGMSGAQAMFQGSALIFGISTMLGLF